MGIQLKFNQEAISQGQETFDYSYVSISEEQQKVEKKSWKNIFKKTD